MWICYHNIIHLLETAEMTSELCDDLINFSFDKLQGANKHRLSGTAGIYIYMHNFFPPFLECLKRLVCYHVHAFYACLFNDAVIFSSRSHLPECSS
jgi:hypothetical protein